MPERQPETLPKSRTPTVAHQFDDAEQQEQASTLGMWVFLSTEVLFFGGLFVAFTVYRFTYPEAFKAAGSHMDFVLGTLNTTILLASSYTMAVSIALSARNKTRAAVLLLVATAALGIVFLGIKFYEYHTHATHHLLPGAGFQMQGPYESIGELFYLLYYIMTGLHAVHLTIGVVLVAVMAVMTARGSFGSGYHTPLELTGLYWHFVDIVWVFLYPMLYLINK